MKLILDERICDDGANEITALELRGGALEVLVGERAEGALPLDAVERVMERYGKALADGIALGGPALDLGDGKMLRMLRHRALYDVIARDFAVLVRPGAEPIASLAITVAGALVHLARAGESARSDASPPEEQGGGDRLS